ncbi:MAG: S41 family peptidase [Anaerolineae bacterium]
MTTDEVVLLIRGEVGTTVTLQVSRGGEANPITLHIERAIIETPSVEWRLLDEAPATGYIKIRLFSIRTGKELARAISEVLDVRGNGGGLLEASVDVSSRFLAGGTVLKEDRRGEAPIIYRTRAGEKILEAPLVVLVDGGTASASEIVAGALQDHKRAVLIGERTFGKGSVQLVYDLSDESSVHVTVAKWFTPNNHSIDGVGLTPDIEVLFSEEDHATGRDPQFQRAVEFLLNGE